MVLPGIFIGKHEHFICVVIRGSLLVGGDWNSQFIVAQSRGKSINDCQFSNSEEQKEERNGALQAPRLQ